MPDVPLWLALLSAAGAAVILRSYRAAGAAAALFLNWCACTYLAHLIADQKALLTVGYASFDLLTAAAILMFPPSRMQPPLGISYACALCAHSAYSGLGASPWNDYHYWMATHWIAWSQFWMISLWVGHDGWGIVRRFADRRSGVHLRRPLPGQAHAREDGRR